MNRVSFDEADGMGAFKRVEVGEERVDEGGGGGTAEEEGCPRVFDGERFLFC